MGQDKIFNSIYDSPDFLPSTNDNIFMNVMRSPEICRGILELVLPDEEFGEIRIMNSPNPFLYDDECGESSLTSLSSETQKTLKFEKDAHGVRFDAFIKSDQLWAEIEMQTGANLVLGKRARYYHANMDLDLLEQGAEYDRLRPSYVIFICTFDYYGKDKPLHFFRSLEKVPEALKPFYEYLNDPSKNQASELTRMIDERVRKFNSDEWRKKYMTFEYMLNERERKGLEQGRSEGEAIGLEKGRTEGEAKKQLEIAKNLKSLGITAAEIVQATGLSEAEIAKL